MRDKEIKRMNRGSVCFLLQDWKVLVLSDSKGDLKTPLQNRPEQSTTGCLCSSFLMGDARIVPAMPITSERFVRIKPILQVYTS